MMYLERAQRYAEARGDEYWFAEVYTRYREHFGVTDSVRKTLTYLYDESVADLLEFQ
jgi:hypothetical protein